MKNFLKEKTKWLLIGRDFSLIDKLVYWFSDKKNSGWVVGNKIRARLYGKIKGKSKLPLIIIGGYPRSGTTLLEVLMEQHPKIANPKREVNIFEDIKTKEILKEGFEFEVHEISGFKKFKKNTVEYSDKILRYYLKKKKAKKILLKQPKHIFLIEEIFKHFPDSKFIHIVRDGRDATMSQRYYLLPKGKKEWPYDWCCRQWVVCINKGEKFRKNEGYIEIKYENLLKEPYKVMKKIFEFLDLNPVPKKRLLNFYKNIKNERYPTHPNLRSPINKNIKGKGLKKMSSEDKKIFKKIAGRTLIELGYEKNNNW